MILEKNQILKRKELSEFFEVKPETISKHKDKYIEELKDYANFELELSESGRFKSVKILEVYCNTYYKAYKKDFINWLKNNDVFKLTGEEGYSNYTIITNYFCSINNIPYKGPHYIIEEVNGYSNNGKRKIKEMKRLPNPEYQVWHYLRRICERTIGDNNKIKDLIPMIADDFQPIYLKKMNEVEQARFDKIVFEIYGNQASNFFETTNAIKEMDTKDMTADELRCEILNLRSIRDMTSKEKKDLLMSRLKEEGLLKFKGYRKKN